ncbi:MAG: DMT family transporter [Nanoarchaeota archaeon]
MVMNKGVLLVLATAIVSGVSIFINSFGVNGFDSSVFTFSKNILVAIFLLSIILGTGLFKHLKKLDLNAWAQLGILGLIGGSIPFLLFFRGLQLTNGATSGFIHKLMFIPIILLAMLFLRERLHIGALVGAALLLFGTFFLLKPGLQFSPGHLLIVAATLFWAAENVYAKHVLMKLQGSIVAFGRMFFGSFFLLLFLLFTGKTLLLFSMSPSQYLWILVTATFLLLYVFTYYNGLKLVKASTAAAILTLGAPITLLLSLIFKGAVISLSQSAGMLLIGSGAAIIIWFSQLKKPVMQHERA